MSTEVPPLPPPPVCLTRSYKSRGIKGGTVIAEDVLDLETHRKNLLDPDCYRAAIGACWSCGSKILHAFCFRERTCRLAKEDLKPSLVATIRLYRCARKPCGAVFTVLPAIIARHLWRLWKTVEEVSAGRRHVPGRTVARWRYRLRSSAVQLVQIFHLLGGGILPGAFRRRLQQVKSRQSLLDAASAAALLHAANSFASLATWIHRLEPGVRLM